MILTFTLILSFLVAINFLLLIFSCNKTSKEKAKTPKVVRNLSAASTTKQLQTNQLAATGS